MQATRYFLLAFLFSFLAFAEADLHFSKSGPRNFGIVVRNADYTLYRSASLGKSGLESVAAYLKERGLPFPKTIIYMNSTGYNYSFFERGLFAVEEYEQRGAYGYEYYHAFRYDYPTYLSGQNPYNSKTNINQRNALSSEAVSYFGFEPNRVIIGDIDAFYRILDLVLNAKEPLLFHCAGGRHRTGMIAMALRYLQGGGWTQGSYKGPSGFRSLNRAQYEYYLHNQEMFRGENLRFIEQWAKDPKFSDYEKRYKEKLNKPTLMNWNF